MSTTKKLIRRTYVRSAEGLYICPECPEYSTPNQSTMCMHMNKHDATRQNKCKWCDKIFVEKQTLEHHIERMAGKGGHPAAAKSTGFECPFEGCAFTSPSKGNCRTHCMRVHVFKETAAILERTKESITCKTCSRPFDTLGAFYYHSIGCISLPVEDARHALLATVA
jgi:hypothetical protein